jgi:predicted phosphate transport protein (TIGR00153 family)
LDYLTFKEIFLLFKKTKEIETQIDTYLDIIIQVALHFREGVKLYMDERFEEFEERTKIITNLESKADELRREIESKLYIHTLIPESRGDVLGLIESSFKVIALAQDNLLEFSVESPHIIEEAKIYYNDLAKASTSAVDYMSQAIRSYFRDFGMVQDKISKVLFFERESDKMAETLKRTVFASEEITLSQKFHHRYFALHIEKLADESERVCDRLSIAVIKRHI